MSTKRVILFTKDSISKNNTFIPGFGASNQNGHQYNQINLNHQSWKCGNVKVRQSESKLCASNDRKCEDSYNQNNYCSIETSASHFLKKNASTKSCENLSKFDVIYDSFNPFQRKKVDHSLNKSTLSLHISAYENALNESQAIIVDEKLNLVQASNESSKSTFNKSWKNVKSVLAESSSVFQNLFKFQRQQIDDSIELPEVMQFKTSQKLFNPNNQSGQRKKLLPQFHDSNSYFKNSIYSTNLASIRCLSTLPPNNNSFIHQLVPFSFIPSNDLGISILHLKENGSESMTPTDLLKKGVIFAKLCSLGSSALGIVMIPVLTSHLWEAAAERPSTMAFALLANSFLGILAFTPLLLHFLAKRFAVNVYYNADTKIFTTVHYNFFLQKRALRFRAEDVVDSAIAPETKQLWLPLATCFVGGKPLLLSLDRRQYRHETAFDLLMKNISIPKGHD